MNDLWAWICEHAGISSTFVIILLTTFVQITPIKFNPWTLIWNYLTAPIKMTTELKNVQADICQIKEGAEALTNITKQVADLNNKIIEMDTKIMLENEKNQQNRAEDARRDILKFGDEVVRGSQLSREHYEEILRLIDVYEHYCISHPQFQNNKCVLTIEGIKEAYKKEFFSSHD